MKQINIFKNQWVVGIGIAVIAGIILSLIFGSDNTAQFNNQNANFNGLNIQGIIKNSNITLIFFEKESTSGIDSNLYPKIFYVHLKPSGIKPNLYNVKINLPDGQKIFLDEVKYDTNYDLASCNVAFTDCVIYKQYRNFKLEDDQVCWILTSRIGNSNLESDLTELGPKAIKYGANVSNDCAILLN
ncbi:MAG: hypothetical protein KJ771_08115 [Nanoarchaeota archaeon]|nr:hypothetical protein [Nanoarchaeota archaeon]